jgi:hypothetical protein
VTDLAEIGLGSPDDRAQAVCHEVGRSWCDKKVGRPLLLAIIGTL